MKELIFRGIRAEDKSQLRELHEQFFPVRYSPEFYDNAVQGIGIKKFPLFSVIVEKDERIVGFLLSQFFPLDQAEDGKAVDIYSHERRITDPKLCTFSP